MLVFYECSSPVLASHGVIPWWASRRSNRHQRATCNKVAASAFSAFWSIIIITTPIVKLNVKNMIMLISTITFYMNTRYPSQEVVFITI